MARVVVIGGSGHVGTYLVPALVERGHEVVNVSRGQAATYTHNPAWAAVEQVVADRTAEDAAGIFGARIVARTWLDAGAEAESLAPLGAISSCFIPGLGTAR